MMRCGKKLGPLNYETDVIHLMRSTKPETDKEFLNEIEKGKYINEKTDIGSTTDKIWDIILKYESELSDGFEFYMDSDTEHNIKKEIKELLTKKKR